MGGILVLPDQTARAVPFPLPERPTAAADLAEETGEIASVLGACCNLADGTCADGIDSTNCAGPNQFHQPSTSCCVAECLPPHQPYAGFGIEILDHFPISALSPISSSANDCWGYVSPGGEEYAIVGTNEATNFVRVTNPTQSTLVASINGTSSFWRDMKIYQQYAYVSNQNGNGVQVFNLTQIDSGIVTSVGNFTPSGLQTIHTVALNTSSGFLYANGSNLRGGDMVPLSLANPANPVAVPTSGGTGVYIHDSIVVRYTEGPMAGKDIAYCACGNSNLRVVDVTNHNPMVLLATRTYPQQGYTHGVDLSEDRQYLFINDEFDESDFGIPATTIVFDVSDPADPVYVRSYNNGKCVIDHDHMVQGPLLYKAMYEYGVTVDDISDVNTAHQVAYRDTHPEANTVDFDGIWGIFAGFPSGIFIGSDIQRGLFVFNYDCNRNGIDDTLEISNGTSEDCNLDEVPDECVSPAASRAGGSPTIRLTPVTGGTPYPPGTTIDDSTRTITIPEPDNTLVFLEGRLNGYEDVGDGTLRAFQIAIDSSTFDNGAGGVITNAAVPCPGGANDCELAQGNSSSPTYCNANVCESAWQTTREDTPGRADYCIPAPHSPACDNTVPDRVCSDSAAGSPVGNQPECYAGTFTLSVPPDAKGTYTIDLMPSGTFVQSGNCLTPPPTTMMSARIIVPTGPCCFDIGNPGAGCTDNATLNECNAMPEPRLWSSGGSCAEGCSGALSPPGVGDDTCQTAGADTGTPCSTNADCTPPAACGNKSRYVSFTPTGGVSSIQVQIMSMKQCAGGANAGRGCETDSHCPGGACLDSPNIGDIWWAGAEQNVPNSPNPGLRGAPLVCAPTPSNAQIWTSGVLHLFGAAIAPGAAYHVRMCDASGTVCSDPLLVATGEWGDVIRGFGGASQPNFADINSIVQKFSNVAAAPSTPRADLVGAGNPGLPNTPNQVTNFADVSADVSAFSGFGFPFTVPPCP